MRMIFKYIPLSLIFKYSNFIVRPWRCLCSSMGLIAALRIHYKDFQSGLTRTEGYSK
jgi:hypothetical protein